MRRMACAALLLLAAQLAASAQAGVTQEENAVSISFDNGVRLTIEAPRGEVRGLTRAEVNGQLLRSPEFPAHPVLKLADEAAHAGCRIEDVQQDGESVVLRCRLRPKAGEGDDSLEWTFEPRSETILDRQYVGFAYRYQFRSPARKLDEILDLGSWEIGGDIEGKFVQPGRLASRAESFRSYPSWTFATTPWFRFQCGEEGALYDVYESVCPVISWVQKRAGSRLLHTFDRVQQELRQEGGTPFRRIMFCDQGGRALECVDEYTRVFDHLEGQARAEFGIEEPEHMPICKAPQRREEMFEARIEELPEIAELGFKGMWMCTLESVDTKLRGRTITNAGIYWLDPAEVLGGVTGLSKLAEAAREHGIRIYTWAPGGQLRPESEVLEAHPEWLLHVPEGKRRPLGGSTDLHSGYYQYAIGKYRELHRATGIDAAWFDSFNAAATTVQVREDGTRHFQIRRAFEMVADTQRAGLTSIQLEGEGPAGQDARTTGYYRIGKPLDYKSAYYVNAARPEEVNYYYRAIANKSFLMMPVRYVLWTYEYKALDQFPELREQVRRANLDWAAVQDLMLQRRLIADAEDPWRDVGVEWTKPGETARALFSYGEFDYPVPAGARVTDVTAAKTVETGGLLRTECCHTYRMEVRE